MTNLFVLGLIAEICVRAKIVSDDSCVPGRNLSFPTSRRCRQYHRCESQKIPYITQPLETAQYLLHTSKSFIRYGDSELLLIQGGSEPFQAYKRDLAQALVKAFEDPDDNIIIGLYDTFSGFPLWNDGFTDWWLGYQGSYRDWILKHADFQRQYFAAMLSSTYVHTYGTHCALMNKVYETLRSIWRGKDIVLLRGDNNQSFTFDVYDTAKTIKVVLAPRYHAWKEYESLKKQLMRESRKKLFILTAGPVSRILAYDLAKAGRRALDLGHLAKDYNLFKLNAKPDYGSFFERDETPPQEL